MEHPENAYPYLLSQNVSNRALRASDASYPSMCTQSILKDEIFDVIIVEYERRRLECLEVFIQRLRCRYPDATIILTKMWNLMEVAVVDSTGNVMKLREALVASGASTMISEEALEYVLSSNYEITFSRIVSIRERAIEKIAKDNKAYVYSWGTDFDMRDLLRFRFKFFADLVHLNDYGHRVVASEIKRILVKARPRRSDNLGSWGDGDFCASWFQTGSFETHMDGREVVHSPLTRITLFDEKNEKYAMELTRPTIAIGIDNPFDGPRKLYLVFMSSYPQRLYPKTSVFIAGRSANESVIIDPVAPYDFPVHVQDTKLVGEVISGKNTIKFTSLEASEFPFRLVGFALTNGDFYPSDMYFKPEKMDSTETM